MGMSCFTVFSASRLWECRVFTLFPYRQVRFNCLFIGFADNRLWEYRIFSFKKTCLAQTSRVFPGKGNGPGFSFSCRPLALDRILLERGRRIFCMHFSR